MTAGRKIILRILATLKMKTLYDVRFEMHDWVIPFAHGFDQEHLWQNRVGWRAQGTQSTWAWLITLLSSVMKRSDEKDPVTHQHLSVPKQEKTSLFIYALHLCISSHPSELLPKGLADICISVPRTLDYLVSNKREKQAQNSLQGGSFAHNPLHWAPSPSAARLLVHVAVWQQMYNVRTERILA